MRHPIRTLVLAAVVGVFAGEARGEDAPSVDELVALALERAPSLTALRARAEAAKEEVGPAGVMPDPTLEFLYQDINFPEYTVGEEEMSLIGVELRQPLPFFGKRGARREAARAQATLRENERAERERNVAFEVRRLYAQIYAVDWARESLTAAAEFLDLLQATITARYSAGQVELADQVKAQLQVSRVRERLDDLEAERAALVAAMNRYLDQPTGAPLGRVASLPDVPPPAAGWDSLALQRSPRLATSGAAVSAAAAKVGAARKEGPTDFFVGAGYAYRGDLDYVGTLRIGTELPFWRGGRTKPLVRAAEKELEMARAEQRDAEAATRAEVARLTAFWTRSEAQVRRYREALLPQSSTALDAARASYLAGRGDFPAVIEGFETWLDSRMQLASREAERYTTWAEIEALVAPPSPAPGEEKP